ncbi:MAG: tRNA lysidine(34) synthetase TilS [Roseiflexaceae bacterium]
MSTRHHPLVRHLANHALLATSQRIVVAVSGGPDSLALLHALCHVFTHTQLAVFHLDHGLRGAQSVADAEFVATCAAALGVAVRCDRADIASEAPHHHNLSEAARVVRYQRMAAYAADCDADIVVVAHTQDDQAETVLMRLLRGSGTHGMAAMRPYIAWTAWAPNDLPGRAALVRPLLDISRATVLDCCAVAALTPRQDPSNHNQSALRVRIRTQLLPQLRQEQPHITQLLAQSALIAGDESAYIDALAAQHWADVVAVAPGWVALRHTHFAALHVSLQRTLVRQAIMHVYATLREVTWVHIEAIRQAVLTQTPAPVSLPHPMRVCLYNGMVGLGTPPAHMAAPIYDAPPHQLTAPADIACGQFQLQVRAHYAAIAHRNDWHVQLPPHHDYVVRTRQPGDRIGIGHGRHRRVQDVFVDAKIPASQRDTWPLVCCGDTVVWVVGIRVHPAFCVAVGSESLQISCVTATDSTV